MAIRSRSRYSEPVTRGNRSSYNKVAKVNQVFEDSGVLTGSYVYETCADTTMPRPYTVDHGLTIEKTVARPIVINGRIDAQGHFAYEDEIYNGYKFHPLSANASLHAFSAFDANYYKTKALANASPYKTSFNLPLFLFELRELPSMIMQLGRVLKKEVKATDVAGGYLAYSFGWAPLVSDLLKLFDLSKAVEERKAYFRRLDSGTHVRRSLGTMHVRDAALFRETLNSGFFSGRVALKVTPELTETRKVWYTLNAKLRQPLNMSARDLHTLSARQVHGLNINPANLWDAIPWSWLIDYFANIGDFLEASKAFVNLDITRINVMCYSKIIVLYEPDSVHPGLEIKPGFVYRTRKARFPFSNAIPVPAPAPFFTMHMGAILGSLATVKLLKLHGVK